MARKKTERTAEEIEMIRAAKRDYDKRWRRENPDKVRAIQERYWMKRFQKMAAEKAEKA